MNAFVIISEGIGLGSTTDDDGNNDVDGDTYSVIISSLNGASNRAELSQQA